MSKEFTDRKAMGAIGNPVVLITAHHDGRANVTTVNMIAGISFSPPLVCISLSHRSFSRSLIDKSNEFAVNVISPEHMELAKQLGRTSGHKVDKFEEFKVESFKGNKTSCPLLFLAHTALECRVEKVDDLGNQNLYVAKVVAYHELKEGNPLYLYHGKYYSIGKQIGTF